jgi:hypothetical protein
MNEQERIKLIDEAIDAFGFEVRVETASFFRTKKGVYHNVKCDEGIQTRLLCTNEEYLARIAERQNKPSWSDVSDDIACITQDSDGVWVGHLKKARRRKRYAGWTSDSQKFILSKGGIGGEVIGRWQDTLEARPVGFVDGDWIDGEGITIDKHKAVSAVAGKSFKENCHPTNCALVFCAKYDHLQSIPKTITGGAQHTLSEWLFKTAPDGCNRLHRSDGTYFYTNDNGDIFSLDGARGADVMYGDTELIATRDAEAVQSEEEPTKASEPFTPEVGGTYFLGNKPGYDLSYGHDIIGENVQLKAIWKTGNGYDVGAVEHESAGYVFMLDMLEPQKSEREEFNDGCVTVHEKLINEWDKDTTIYEAIYDAMKSGELPAPNPQPKISREEFIEKAVEISNRMIDADMSDSVLVYGALYDELVSESGV